MRNVAVPHWEQLGRAMELECGVAGANSARMPLPSDLDEVGILHPALAEFDRHCFAVRAHPAFINALFIVLAICRFDARQKQLRSATGTTTAGNRRQWGRIRTIWLRHGRSPRCLQAGAQLVSQSPTPG